jgi:hypothetical protein
MNMGMGKKDIGPSLNLWLSQWDSGIYIMILGIDDRKGVEKR